MSTNAITQQNTSCMQPLYDFHNYGVMKLGDEDSCIVTTLKITDEDSCLATAAKMVTIIFTAIVALIGKIFECCNSSSSDMNTDETAAKQQATQVKIQLLNQPKEKASASNTNSNQASMQLPLPSSSSSSAVNLNTNSSQASMQQSLLSSSSSSAVNLNTKEKTSASNTNSNQASMQQSLLSSSAQRSDEEDRANLATLSALGGKVKQTAALFVSAGSGMTVSIAPVSASKTPPKALTPPQSSHTSPLPLPKPLATSSSSQQSLLVDPPKSKTPPAATDDVFVFSTTTNDTDDVVTVGDQEDTDDVSDAEVASDDDVSPKNSTPPPSSSSVATGILPPSLPSQTKPVNAPGNVLSMAKQLDDKAKATVSTLPTSTSTLSDDDTTGVGSGKPPRKPSLGDALNLSGKRASTPPPAAFNAQAWIEGNIDDDLQAKIDAALKGIDATFKRKDTVGKVDGLNLPRDKTQRAAIINLLAAKQ